jgi:tetratricopeptide (TPR) repeat protein
MVRLYTGLFEGPPTAKPPALPEDTYLNAKKWTRMAVLSLLLIMAAEIVFSVRSELLSWDEDDAWQLSQNKDLAGALQSAETAVSIDPQFINAQRVLGQMLQDQGRNAEVTIHYNQALAIARTMEPSAQEEPVNWINQRLAELSKSTTQEK